MAHTPLAARKGAESSSASIIVDSPRRFRVENRTQAIVELPLVEGMEQIVKLYPEIDKSADGKLLNTYDAEGDVAARLKEHPIFCAFVERRMLVVHGDVSWA